VVESPQTIPPRPLQNAQFLGSFAKFRKATVSFVMSVRLSAWNNWTPTGRIFMKFDILNTSRKSVGKKCKFYKNLTVTLHEDQYTFFIIFRSVLLRMKNVSDGNCRENQNTFCVQ
jgi:hypothetical protein